MSSLFGCVEKRFDKKAQINFKIYVVTDWIVNNYNTRQNNQAMKFGQLIKQNVRNIFLETLCTKYGVEASPRPFYKIFKIEYISWSTVWNVIKFVFIVCPSQDLPKSIKTKVLIICFHLT